MIKRVALCLSTNSISDNLFSELDINNKTWLTILNHAEEFRGLLSRDIGIGEVWIYSCDDMEGINLAAACKKDYPSINVVLVSNDCTGSMRSRANCAKINKVIDKRSFYHLFKKTNQDNENFKKSINNGSDTFKTTILKNDLESKSNKVMSKNEKHAFILPVFSASGGAGKSTISALIALLSSLAGWKTLIIDGDFQLGNISEFYGLEEYESIDRIIESDFSLNKLHTKENYPDFLAPPRLSEYSESVIEQFQVVLDNLSMQYDVIVVNTGSFWTEEHAILLENCYKSLFLIDQNPLSLNAVNKVLNLCNRCNIPTSNIVFGLNKCNKNSIFTGADISGILPEHKVFEILDGGINVTECLASGCPEDLIKEKNLMVLSLWKFIKSLFPKKLNNERFRNFDKEVVEQKAKKLGFRKQKFIFGKAE